MFRQSVVLLKKKIKHNPGRSGRGAKNLAWAPKVGKGRLKGFVPLNLVSPGKIPNNWHDLEYRRLGYETWPKAVGFWNAGNNWELTPDMSWRLFEANKDESFWSSSYNEKTIVALMPWVEENPEVHYPKITAIVASHTERFGLDHTIVNAAMQAAAFARRKDECDRMYEEMKAKNLEPNVQTVVNMMLCCKLCNKDEAEGKKKAEKYFQDGIKTGVMTAVMRLDTEFQMWWDQFKRLGSFTATATTEQGFLSVKEEGAKPRPDDMWALWGWDERVERKFVSRREYVQEQANKRANVRRKYLYGSLMDSMRRKPWKNYRGVLPHDVKGPQLPRSMMKSSTLLSAPPPPNAKYEPCGPSYGSSATAGQKK